MKKFIGIDLGTSNTVIYVPKKGIIFNEPTVVAINSKKRKVIEVGYLAMKMLGRAPNDVSVIKPVRKGVIFDLNACSLFLKKIFANVKLTRYVKKATIIFSAPTDISPIEKRALRDLGAKLNCDGVLLESQARLASIGSAVDIHSTRGSMTVNIGGGITDVSILAGGEVIISKTALFSGLTLDEAILRHLRNQHHLIVGQKTSEFIKMKIGSVEQIPENRLVEVTGRDIVSSLPHAVIISTTEIKNVLISRLTPLIEAIVDCLELTPPEIASDIVESGILISGGTALLAGIREHLEKQTNVPVRISSNPANAVILGLQIITDQHSNKKRKEN